MKQKSMTKTEFIAGLRKMADTLETGGFFTGYIGDSFVFGNRNYGEISISLGDCSLEFGLYNATIEEQKYAEEQSKRGECVNV